MFVGGALASQNGLGDLIPAKLILRSAITMMPFPQILVYRVKLIGDPISYETFRKCP
jgi:hypothetical protein